MRLPRTYSMSAAWHAAPLTQEGFACEPGGSNFGECQNTPIYTFPPVLAKSLANARISHIHILSVSIWCERSWGVGGLIPDLTRVCRYLLVTSSLSPSFNRKDNSTPASTPALSGRTPKLSFFTVVMRMGTLFHFPCAISCRGSPGKMSPSTTTCHPRSANASPTCLTPFCSSVNLSSDTEFFTKSLTWPGLVKASPTQSMPQSFWAGIRRRHRSRSLCLPLQPARPARKLVRSALAVREKTSAGGECMRQRWKRPADAGETRCERRTLAPSLLPMSVTLPGSPPKAETCLCTHWSISCWSIKPRLLVTPEPAAP
mmetsp:Transcript_7371/g.21621  ORF Transcript_7371/g.21621 Transcript_7371/m.21621 type:complete len:315 (-) Transcript_7371:388-1332(-)